MMFVWVAGIELDLQQGLGAPRAKPASPPAWRWACRLLFGCVAALAMLAVSRGWIGAKAQTWQFVLGIGMACAVTALPILILLMEKLEILRQPIGQRILRYASLDDIAIWGVLALILIDWERVGRQVGFLVAFARRRLRLLRKLMRAHPRARPLVCRPDLAGGLRASAPTGRACTSWSARSWPARSLDSRLVRPEADGPAPPPRAAGRDAGVLPEHRPAHQLGGGRRARCSSRRRCCCVASVGGKLIGVHIAGQILNGSRARPR